MLSLLSWLSESVCEDLSLGSKPARPRAYRMPMPNALVIRTAGTNCEQELLRAFSLAGAKTTLVHLDTLIKDPTPIDNADLIGFPGGFSYGDDIASGRIFAMRTRLGLVERLKAAVDRGAGIIGICNGFQVLVQTDLLPGVLGQRVALAGNAGGTFISDWVDVDFDQNADCIWTRGLANLSPEIAKLPIAHAEGCLVADDETVSRLTSNGQVVLRYKDEVNGSVNRIAGICDPTGRIFGLMPHPERYLDWNRHPAWTRLSNEVAPTDPVGLRMFKGAVEAVTGVGAR
ncbi:MAG: phosphoribosylformylglycinamidine synthase I [Phycisphaera sp.]|nr:MAG: phosphoribosylformylglycinamidine synthase I [Phycisphaera sp.]